ncbi:hypothetical protein Tco_0034311 [Tanacetum coccineum]
MVAFDGAGFDWSFMANEEVPTNLALMAFSDSEVNNHKTCSDTCLKSYETLKSQYDSLRVEFNKSEFDLATYKRGLASIEEQLVFYKKNEVMLCDQIAVLKRDASFKDSEINALNIQIEKLKKEKESNQIKIDNFENASKNLDKLIGSQISDNNRKGVGYNVVPPPPTGLFAPPTIDLSSSGLKEFQQPEFEGYGVNVNKSVSENSSNEIKKTTGAPIIEDWVSDCDEDESEVMVSNNVQHKSELKPEQAKQPRKISENPRNNRTNWNEKKTQKLGVGFQFTKKACFVCGSFNHLIKDCDFHDKKMVQKPVMNNVQKGTGQREVRPVWNNALRTNHQNFSNSRRNFAPTNFSNSRRNFAPTAVLTKSAIVPISTARQNSSRAAAPLGTARPINTVAPNSLRPFNQQTALSNRNLNNKVNTAKVNSVNTAKGKRVTSAVGEQGINVVKSSACWVWRPKRNIVDHGDPQAVLKEYDWKDLLHQTKSVKYIGKLKEVETLRYLSLVVPLIKISDEVVHKELGDRMERVATTASSLVAEQDSEKTITEASLRRHLKLEDNGGVTTLPNSEIFEQLALMGYETDSDKLTFQKGNFSPQWWFFIHTILHCLSPKKTAWEQFSSNIATAIICLATTRTFNFSKFIFDAMVKNLDNPHKFLMTRVVLSDEEEVSEDPSKQGRSLIEELDLDVEIYLVPPHASEIQEKISNDTEVLLEEEETTELVEEPIELVEDQGNGEKGNKRSAEKRKDKGKAIMIEDESIQKKSKKQLEQERLKEYDKAGKKEVVAEVDTAHVIDWNDPSVIRYHALQDRPRSVAKVRKNMLMYLKNQGGYKMKDFKGMSYNDIRLIFEKVWEQVHSFVPMDSEEEVQRLKRVGQDVEAEP